jgi:hypothetical protein
MASYTADQLYGSGTYAEALSGTKTFQFTNPSDGSAYFILEAVRNDNGFYDSTSNTVASASYSLGSGVDSLVTSSYIAGVAIEPGVHSMSITFESNTPLSGSFLRSTGGISLVIS